MSEMNRNRSSRSGSRTGNGRSAAESSSKSRSGSGQRSTRTSSTRQSSADRILAVQNARNRSASSGARRRGKKRRQGPDFAKLLLILIGAVILILCIAVGVRGCAKEDGNEESQTENETTEPETELEAEITVNGVSVHGLTKTEAMEKVLETIGWDMKVAYNGETKVLDNLMESRVDAVLTEAFGKGEAGTYTVTADGLAEQVKAQVDSLAEGWDVKAKNGSISSYDADSDKFVFSGAQSGVMIERDTLAEDIMKALEARQYKKTIEAKASEIQPEITEEEARANFKRIGTYTTTTTSNKDRNENIRIAASALNGIIIQPGEEFSFNLTTGNRTTEKGYRPAGAYQNGVLVEEPGGGVCQVSSTLYNAVVFSGLKTTERHAHSYEPSYVTPGEDAMVSYDGFSGPDMKFVNNSKTAVGIKTSFSNQKLICSIYGNPILEEGVTLSMKSEKVAELNPPEPEYVEDPTLEPGVEVEAKKATPGSRWVTRLITKKNGETVEEVHLHNSTYNGKPATIKRNTSGSVVTTEGESPSDQESSSESSSSEETVGSSAEPSVSQPGNQGGPASENPQESSPQNMGPGDMIEPSSEERREPGFQDQGGGPEPGPGGFGEVTNMPQTAPVPTTPVQPETNGGPSDVGMISPLGQ